MTGKFYYRGMKKKVTEEMVRLVQAELGHLGGQARAKKYSKKQLSEWAKKGGRPRKDANNRASSRGKGRQR